MPRKSKQQPEGEGAMTEPKPTRNERWQQVLHAADTGIIDPRDAIIEAQEHYEGVYGANFGAAIKMLEDIDAKIDADRNDRKQVLDFLQRQDKKSDEVIERLKKAETSHQALTSEVRALAGIVNNLGEEVSDHGGRLAAVESRVGNLETRMEAVEHTQQQLIKGQEAIKHDLDGLREWNEAFPPIEEIRRLMGDRDD